MDVVFRTVVQLTITTTVTALNFEGLMKQLPIPADLKAVLSDLNQKQLEFSMPDIDDVLLMEFKTGTPFIARNPNGMIKPTSTVMTKIVSKINKPVTKMDKPVTKMNKPVTKMNKPVTKMNKPVTPRNRILRSIATTVNPQSSCMKQTTAKSIEKLMKIPFLPMPMPMPMGIPIYASAPVMLPMRSYFEKVKHDHPPLYKIKQMIEEDNKKWNKDNNEISSDISIEIADSDISSDQSIDMDTYTDTDSSFSEYSDVGPEYYDAILKINTGGRGRDR